MVNFGKNYESEKIDTWKINYFDFNKLKKMSNRDTLKNTDEIDEFFNNFDNIIIEEIEMVNNFYNEEINNISSKLIIFNQTSNENKSIFFKNLFTNCDNLRHFIILNTIAIIKLVKRRNKRIFKTISVMDLIGNQDFYKCEQLNTIYNNLDNIAIDKKIEYADDLLSNMGMLVSLKTLQNIRKNTNFDSYDLLPNYDKSSWTDESFREYLINKLGPCNKLVDILPNVQSSSISITELDRDVQTVTKPKKIFYTTIILGLLYLFLFGLDLMSNSFKVLSGKGMSNLFSYVSNPVAGVMIGIIATVLLQSSSTTTSIVVTMVGANIINVATAIPIIMGANIGTSISNTLVSHAHIKNVNEFRRAFAGATVHDMFNLLSVFVLLPLELISRAAGYSILYSTSKSLTSVFIGANNKSFNSPIKIIMDPFTKLFMSIDKNVIKGVTNGCQSCGTNDCWDLKHKKCLTRTEWNSDYKDARIITGGVLKDLGDVWGGIVGLIISLAVLCIVLYYIIKILHKLVLSSGGRGRVLNIIKKSLSINSYLTMLVGMLLTISVQSSSIITSTFTPLVGLNILTVEQMFPITLGANIGTTFTAILASLVTDSSNAIQIALCHFLFNIMGILVWYPLPFTRKIPLNMAYRLGDLVAKYKWFGIFYIVYTFVFFPVASWGISFLISLNTAGLIFGTLLLFLLCFLSVLLFNKFDKIGDRLEKCCRKTENISDIEMGDAHLM